MNATKGWVWLTALVLLCTAVAVAQDYYEDEYDDYAYEDERSARRENVPPAGFWPTERMIELTIDRITDDLGRIYGFDEAQLWETRDLFKNRFPAWLQENRPRIQRLMNEYVEDAVLAEEPPSAEQMAEWARRAQPLIQEFTGMMEDTAEDMRVYMTEEQRVILDGEMAAVRVGVSYMNQRMDTWAHGGYDWRYDWPQSAEFREAQQAREKAFEDVATEARDDAIQGRRVDPDLLAREAEARAMGLEVGLASDEQYVPPERPIERARAAAAGKPGPQDDWEAYTEAFIRRYNLNEAQTNRARGQLTRMQEQRDRYLRVKLPVIKELEKQLAGAKDEKDRSRVREKYEQIQSQMDRLFQSLKDRLNKLPTSKQRADAAQRELQVRNTEGADEQAPE
jgi:hypothetical protein